MSRKRKSDKLKTASAVIKLITTIVELIIALLLLIDKT